MHRIGFGIQHYDRLRCNRVGTCTGYHETITRFWVHMLRCCLNEAGSNDGFVAVTNRLDGWAHKDLPFEFYSRELLMSKKAGHHWVEPDLKPLQAIESQGNREEITVSGGL